MWLRYQMDAKNDPENQVSPTAHFPFFAVVTSPAACVGPHAKESRDCTFRTGMLGASRNDHRRARQTACCKSNVHGVSRSVPPARAADAALQKWRSLSTRGRGGEMGKRGFEVRQAG